MTDSNTDPPNEEPKQPRPEFDHWREMLRTAFSEGRTAGAEAGHGSADKVRDVFQKALYDASYGIAYGLAYTATMAKESVVRPTEDGAAEGMRAGREAAERERADQQAADPDGTPGFAAG